MVNKKDKEMQSWYPELDCECEDVSVYIAWYRHSYEQAQWVKLSEQNPPEKMFMEWPGLERL